MNRLVGKVFQHREHLTPDKVYRVIGVGRHVRDPHSEVVIYEARYSDVLRDIDITLPAGSIWLRNKFDFMSRFTDENHLLASREYIKILTNKDIINKDFLIKQHLEKYGELSPGYKFKL